MVHEIINGRSGFSSNNRNFISYPTTAAWIQRVRRGSADGTGRVQLALSLITPQSTITRQRLALSIGRVASPSNPSEQVAQEILVHGVIEDDSLWVGLAAAWKIGPRVAVGATLFTTIRTGLYQRSTGLIAQLYDQGSTAEKSRYAMAEQDELHFSHFGLLGLVGVLISPTPEFHLGAAFRTPSVELRGKGDLAVSSTPPLPDGGFKLEVTKYDGVTFHDKQPLKATLGLAYIAPRRFGVSLDFSLYGPIGEYAVLEYEADPSVAAEHRMEKKLVWQINAGGEDYLTRAFPLRLGFFTDRSSLADLQDCTDETCKPHENLFTDGVDLYGFAGSIGYETEKATLNLGCTYSFGARTTITAQDVSLETRRSFLFLALGGSFRF
jgi:hypothetical protein